MESRPWKVNRQLDEVGPSKSYTWQYKYTWRPPRHGIMQWLAWHYSVANVTLFGGHRAIIRWPPGIIYLACHSYVFTAKSILIMLVLSDTSFCSRGEDVTRGGRRGECCVCGPGVRRSSRRSRASGTSTRSSSRSCGAPTTPSCGRGPGPGAAHCLLLLYRYTLYSYLIRRNV